MKREEKRKFSKWKPLQLVEKERILHSSGKGTASNRVWDVDGQIKLSKSPENIKMCYQASLVVRRLKIHLLVQGTQVQSLVQQDPTWCGATRPMHHNPWSPLSREQPPQLEACTPQLKSSSHSPQLEKAHTQQEEPAQPISKCFFKKRRTHYEKNLIKKKRHAAMGYTRKPAECPFRKMRKILNSLFMVWFIWIMLL